MPHLGFRLMTRTQSNLSGLLSQNKCLIRYKFLLLPCALILVSRIKDLTSTRFIKFMTRISAYVVNAELFIYEIGNYSMIFNWK